MKKLNIIPGFVALTIILISTYFVSCTKDPEVPEGLSSMQPFDKSAINITAIEENVSYTTANFTVTVANTGGRKIQRLLFCYNQGLTVDTTSQSINLGSVNANAQSAIFNVNLTELSHNSQYSYSVFAVYSDYLYNTTKANFTTLEDIRMPTVVTYEAHTITENSAKIDGTLYNTGEGYATVIQHGHVWATHNNPTIDDFKTELGASSRIDFTSDLMNLEHGTTYYYRAYATNAHATSYSEVLSFRTISLSWKQKAWFPGFERYDAVGFSIDGNGYIGTGNGPNPYPEKDFWKYNPITNTWTQIADCEHLTRAVGFSINNKGYVGTGTNADGQLTDIFYEYEPDANEWTQKANFGGGAICDAVGFSIGSKGYIGTGYGYVNSFWEYNPDWNVWAQKANFRGTGRALAVGFSIDNKGYIGTGYGDGDVRFDDFWEYDPTNNTWTQIADYGGGKTSYAFGFAIENKGYVGVGSSTNGLNKDFWEYNPANNTWTQKSNYYGGAGYGVTGFAIGNKGFIGTGYYIDWGNSYSKRFNDFWEYNPEMDN